MRGWHKSERANFKVRGWARGPAPEHLPWSRSPSKTFCPAGDFFFQNGSFPLQKFALFPCRSPSTTSTAGGHALDYSPSLPLPFVLLWFCLRFWFLFLCSYHGEQNRTRVHSNPHPRTSGSSVLPEWRGQCGYLRSKKCMFTSAPKRAPHL